VDRFMGTVKQVVKVTISQHGDWQQELREFLLAYRATPHCTTKQALVTLLFVQDQATWGQLRQGWRGSPRDRRLRQAENEALSRQEKLCQAHWHTSGR
jgi:hypothetical protein